MVKLMVAGRRKAGTTHAEFCEYTRGQHAKLVLASPNFAQNTVAYKQNHVFDGAYGLPTEMGYDPMRAHYDSIVEISLHSLESMSSPENASYFEQVIQPDEDNFADREGSLFLQASERDVYVAADAAGAQLKVICFIRAAQGAEALLTSWTTAHDAVIAEDGDFADRLLRYQQNDVSAFPGMITEFANVAMLWLRSREDGAAFMRYWRTLSARIGDGGPIDFTRSFCLFTEEVVFLSKGPKYSG